MVPIRTHVSVVINYRTTLVKETDIYYLNITIFHDSFTFYYLYSFTKPVTEFPMQYLLELLLDNFFIDNFIDNLTFFI